MELKKRFNYNAAVSAGEALASGAVGAFMTAATFETGSPILGAAAIAGIASAVVLGRVAYGYSIEELN